MYVVWVCVGEVINERKQGFFKGEVFWRGLCPQMSLGIVEEKFLGLMSVDGQV